ncbi:predicted protein [Thalassiosira pseudonana CCMP1335]|uniref:Uncharacterized protein n=1 Tax=Thalassiosira pseudonana TaxID=35128 RepID=B8LDC3_THAPS|nr:predicted protein [Thalassiosira pseudonana CCMP1335]EED86781.1 predicted protein [Thalassiosira pseudonana CCMP1335]
MTNLREMAVITRRRMNTASRSKKRLLLTQHQHHVLLFPRGVCHCQQLLMDTEAMAITIRTNDTLRILITAHQLHSAAIVTVVFQLQLTTTQHAPYPPPYFHPGSCPYNQPYHQRYYPSAHQHYSSSTVTYNPHPYGSVNVATSEYNSPKRFTNAHDPSVTTTSNATVPGEDTTEDERKLPADVTDTSAQSRSGGCEGFVAPVIWNGNPAGDQSPLPETKTTIGAPRRYRARALIMLI